MIEQELTENEVQLFRQLATYSKPFLPSEAHVAYGNGEDYWEWFFKLIGLMRTGLFQITEETRPAGVPVTFELTEAGKTYVNQIENRVSR
jgi:hypothetical protein